MIIKTKDLVLLFGNDKQKEYYEKYSKLPVNIKNAILNIAKEEYKIVKEIGRGKYEIDIKFNGTSAIPNNKMEHQIFGNLLPAILFHIKDYHDNQLVFCLSMNSIYIELNTIHRYNYINIKNKKIESSKILDINLETIYEFFEVTHSSLKYYLENSIKILESMGLIKCNKILYLKEFSQDETENNIKLFRRASKEEEQFMYDLEGILEKRFDIKNQQEKYFGSKSKEYNTIKKDVLQDNKIDFFYENYELICINKKDINNILEFHDISEGNILSENFIKNFINLIITNAEGRHKKAIENNKIGFYRFSKQYLEDFGLLSNCTLNCNNEIIKFPNKDFSNKKEELICTL